MKRCLLAVAFTFFLAGVASAAPIFTPSIPGSAMGSIFTPGDASPIIYDVQSIAMGEVTDPAMGTDLGSLFLFSGGPYPSDTLLLYSSDLSEHSSLLFDFSTSMFDATRSTWTVQATGTPAGIVSDPALSAFNGLVFAQFARSFVLSLPTGTLEAFQLTSLSKGSSAPIPEPATMGLVGLGLAALGYGMRRGKTRTSLGR